MAISKKSAEKSAETKETIKTVDHEIEVLRAHDLGEDQPIMFDMNINGISIYGCAYKVLKYKDEAKGTFVKIEFPSKKGSDGKWYNQAYVRLSDADIDTIEKGIEALI